MSWGLLRSFHQRLNQWCGGSPPNPHSVVWNQPWWDYLHYGNRQKLQMRVLWSLGFGVLGFPFSSKVVYQLTLLGVLAAETLSWIRSHSLPEGILHPRLVNAESDKVPTQNGTSGQLFVMTASQLTSPCTQSCLLGSLTSVMQTALSNKPSYTPISSKTQPKTEG